MCTGCPFLLWFTDMCPFLLWFTDMCSQGDPNVLVHAVLDYLVMVLVTLGYPVLLVGWVIRVFICWCMDDLRSGGIRWAQVGAFDVVYLWVMGHLGMIGQH